MAARTTRSQAGFYCRVEGEDEDEAAAGGKKNDGVVGMLEVRYDGGDTKDGGVFVPLLV